VLWNVGILRDAAGVSTGVVAVGQDITARKRTEKALRATQERLRFLVGAAPVVLFISRADPPNEVLFVSDTVRGLTGYAPEEFTRDPAFWNRLVYPEDLPGLRSAAERPWLPGESRQFEYRLRHREGGCRWVHSVVRLVRDSEQPGGDFVGCLVDVTVRKKTEEALRLSEEHFRGVFEFAPLGIVIAGPDGRPIRANPAFCRMVGYTEAELRRLHYLEITHPDDRHLEPPLVEQALRGDIDFARLEKRYVHKRGHTVYVALSMAVVKGDADNFLAGVVLVEDITLRRQEEEERRRLEEKLRQAQKLESMGIMAGGIAHDFNNLLTGILGYANLAAREAGPAIRDYLEQISRASHRASDLCEQMLACAGRGRTTLAPLDLSALAAETTDLLRPALPAPVGVQFELASELPRVEGDATQLRQVVMNLVLNAAEAMAGEQGRITVRTGCTRCDRAALRSTYLEEDLPEGEYVFLEVADTGSGMDAATRAKIFEPFFTTKFMGRGLGLAAVLGIVRGHRGAIQLDTEVGRGTTFRVLLPRAARTPTPQLPAPAARLDTSTVLLVDDEEFIRDLGNRVLRAAGYQVLLAADGQEAVEIFRDRSREISVVVLDVLMPRLGGEAALRHFRSIDPNVRVVLSSGYSEHDVGERMEGVAVFLQKPYRPDDLLEAVRRAAGRFDS
jgi:PAS domain S-box-containing protein